MIPSSKPIIISLIEKATGTKIQSYTGHKLGQFTVDVRFNPSDTHLLTGSEDGSLVVFDVMKPTPIKQIKAHQKVLSAMDIDEDKGIVTASHDGTVCYWKLK